MKQDKNREIGLQRLFFFSVVGFFCTIRFSFWPPILKQDYIPFYPIVSLSIAVPLVMLAERFQRFLPAFALPALVTIGELASLISGHPPLKKTNQKSVQLIADVLRLTHPRE